MPSPQLSRSVRCQPKSAGGSLGCDRSIGRIPAERRTVASALFVAFGHSEADSLMCAGDRTAPGASVPEVGSVVPSIASAITLVSVDSKAYKIGAAAPAALGL